MRSTAFLLVMVTALLDGSAPARAEQTRVAVSWSGVRDADVQRCGLSRLRAGTIERLVGAGYAVVENAAGSGVQVTVTSVTAPALRGGASITAPANGLKVRVQGSGLAREELLDAGADCDATFVLDVISRVAELVDEVAQASAAHGEQAASAGREQRQPALASTQPTATSATPRAALQAELDFTARGNESPDYQLGGGVGVRLRLADGWESAARAELTAHAARGVTVLEAFLGLGGAYQPSLPGVAPVVELGPVLHHAASDVRSVTKLDALLAAGVQLSVGHFLAQLLLYGRLRSFAHRVGPETAFDTGRVGLVLRLGAQLSGS